MPTLQKKADDIRMEEDRDQTLPGESGEVSGLLRCPYCHSGLYYHPKLNTVTCKNHYGVTIDDIIITRDQEEL